MHTKKPLSILLTIALVLGLLPWAAMPAFASGSGTEPDPYQVGAWTDLQTALDAGGYVKLTQDVTAASGDAALTVSDGKTVTLDLAGHSIDRGLSSGSADENGYVICVKGSLTITDSGTGGTITGGNTQFGGGVIACENAVFTMNGGTISGNKANVGGGVCVNGAFTMNGGTIGGNTANSGGGVYVGYNGTFAMNGGTITGNAAITHYSENNHPYRGEGGGVYAGSGGTFAMNGGAVTGNTADAGGGAYVYGSAFLVSGGARVTGNTAGGAANNVYLEEFDPDEPPVPVGEEEEHTHITVAGALTSGATIGVTMKTPGVFTQGLKGNGSAASFTSDDSAYYVSLSTDGEAALAEVVHVTDVTLNKTELSLTVGSSETLTATVEPADATYEAVTWSSDKAAVATVDAGGKVTAVAVGSATITATADGKSASCTVTVKDPVPALAPFFPAPYTTAPATAANGNAGNAEPAPAPVETSGREAWTAADGSSVSKELKTGTSTVRNEDGSVTVTDTVKETITTEKKDGSSVEVVTESTRATTTGSAVNEDGSVTDTTKVNATETVTETTKDADGKKSTVETKTEQESSTAVTTTENEDGTVSEKTVTEETVKVTEKVTDAEGNVTEKVTETTTETVVNMTVGEDGKKAGTAVTTTTVKDANGNVLSESVTETEITVATDETGNETTETKANTTTKDANGIESVKNTVTTETKTPDGSTGTVVRNDGGNVLSRETTISQEALETAMEENRPVQTPLTVDPESLTEDGELPQVKVTLPPNFYDKDGDGVVSPGERPKIEIAINVGGAGVVVAEAGADGTLIIRKDCYEGSVIVPVIGSCELVVIDNTRIFADVPQSEWYYEYVTFVTAREIFSGTGDGSFAPNAPMTRAMLAQTLYNFTPGAKAGDGTVFADVKAGDWYNAAVGWAYENGIVTGYGDTFGASDNVTRQDLATILYRYAKTAGYDVSARGDLSGFSDALDVADYARDAMRWAVGMGLIDGIDGRLDANGSATRAQVAAIMTRFVRNMK